MVTSRNVCVIGAGISGLAAAKAFHSKGHRVTVIERGADLGGVWEPSRSYPDVQTQTPKDIYAFSEMAMPKDYPEWPSGRQMFDYLKSYAERFELGSMIRYGRSVSALKKRSGPGWDVTTEASDGSATTEAYDFVAVCTGQFSHKNMPVHPGADAFRAAGGAILHSSEHTQADFVTGKRVVILGFAKSATDVAVSAVNNGAAAVTLVYLTPTWKIPYFLGGLINFKNILYCRAAESMFPPCDASPFRRALQTLALPLIWCSWRGLETLLKLQFKLKKNGLLPKTRIEDKIHCNLAIETPGFYKLVSQGRIATIQGTIARYEHRHAMLTGGERLEADLVVMATGWRQDVPFLDAADRVKVVDADGQYRLYRMIVHPNLKDLGFVGFNSSFASNISAELGANWLVRYMDGQLKHQPTMAQMEAAMARQLAWRYKERPAALNYGGLCIAPYHNRHFDELLSDMGAPTRGRNPIAATFAPLRPPVYAFLLAKARDYRATVSVASAPVGLRPVTGTQAA